MSKLFQDGFLKLGVALATLVPLAAGSQVNPCGPAGTPPCPVPEPHGLALVGLAIGVAALVLRITRK